MSGYNETEAYLAKILSPDQKRAEGLDEPGPITKNVLVECGDGRTRLVKFCPDNGLVISSIVTKEPIEEGWQPEDPTWGVGWPD